MNIIQVGEIFGTHRLEFHAIGGVHVRVDPFLKSGGNCFLGEARGIGLDLSLRFQALLFGLIDQKIRKSITKSDDLACRQKSGIPRL